LVTRVIKSKTRKRSFLEKMKIKGNVVIANLVNTKLYFGNDESSNSYFKNDRIKCIYEYVINGISYKRN